VLSCHLLHQHLVQRRHLLYPYCRHLQVQHCHRLLALHRHLPSVVV
jgi:hypothetical protein